MVSVSKTKLHLYTCCFLFSAASYAENSVKMPEPLAITEQRNAAVGYVLSFTATVVNVTNTCKMVPSLSKSPIDAFTSWQLRNGKYFEASQGWINYVSSQVKATRGQAASDEFRKRVVGEAAKSGETTVKGFFSTTPRTEVCEKWIGLLFSPQSDLINNKSEFNNEVREIVEFHKAVSEWQSGRGDLSLAGSKLQDAVAASNRGDYKTELEILTPLAESGNPDALGNIGNMYAFGKGVEQNLATAYSYWSRAAEKHLGTAMFNIASLYATGQGGLPKDQSQAALWYKKAAENRHEKAMINLSSIYATGQGLEKNKQLAVAWASLASTNTKSEQSKNLYLSQLRDLATGMSKEEMDETQKLMYELAKNIDANVAKYRMSANPAVHTDAAR